MFLAVCIAIATTPAAESIAQQCQHSACWRFHVNIMQPAEKLRTDRLLSKLGRKPKTRKVRPSVDTGRFGTVTRLAGG